MAWRRENHNSISHSEERRIEDLPSLLTNRYYAVLLVDAAEDLLPQGWVDCSDLLSALYEEMSFMVFAKVQNSSL